MTGGRPASRQQGGSRRALVAAAPETFGVPAYVGRHGWVSIQLATVDPTDVKAAMSDLDDFLATTLDRQIKAEEAVHNGDLGPRLAMWSTKDPVTVFGAVRGANGWDEVSQLFGWLGEHFSDCTPSASSWWSRRGARPPPDAWSSPTTPIRTPGSPGRTPLDRAGDSPKSGR